MGQFLKVGHLAKGIAFGLIIRQDSVLYGGMERLIIRIVRKKIQSSLNSLEVSMFNVQKIRR